MKGKGRKVKAGDPNESYDLTDGSFDVSPPKRSRRLGDTLEISATIEVNPDGTHKELNNNKGKATEALEATLGTVASINPLNETAASLDSSLDNSLVKTGRRRGRKPKAAPKPKRLTLKQALAIVNAPLPAAPFTPPPTREPQPVASTSRIYNSRSSGAIDLTGDVMLTDKHSSAPLFTKQKTLTEVKSTSSDDFDPDLLKIKFKYKNKIESLPLRRHQRYYDLLKNISEQFDIPISNIYLYDGDKRIHHDDTPHNTKYKITTILACRVMEKQVNDSFIQSTKKDQIEIKFQSDKWKRPIAVKISKVDDFKVI